MTLKTGLHLGLTAFAALLLGSGCQKEEAAPAAPAPAPVAPTPPPAREPLEPLPAASGLNMEKVLLDPKLKELAFVVYEWEVPGSPGSGEYGNVSVVRAQAGGESQQVAFFRGEELPDVPKLTEALRQAGAK